MRLVDPLSVQDLEPISWTPGLKPVSD